jgi:hypothetical protein
MNYYEELGIRADAEVGEIRKAHRRLVKLMHPDHQRDPNMKRLAETQMRRLNIIVSTLVDPDQRGEYDEALRGRYMAQPTVVRSWRGVPWWLVSTVGATVLTVGAVWTWADHLGSSYSPPLVYAPPQDAVHGSGAIASADPAKAPASANPGKAVDRSNITSVPVTVPGATAQKKKDIEPAPSTSQTKTAKAVGRVPSTDVPGAATLERPLAAQANVGRAIVDPYRTGPNQANTDRAALDRKKEFRLPPGVPPMLPANRPPAVALPPAPGLAMPSRVEMASVSLPSSLPVVIAPKPDIRNPSSRSNSLEGEWVYAPKEPEKPKAGFYPPEFINFRLSQQHQGGLEGQYNARYAVSGANKPISPDVSFEVVASEKDARKFTWHSSNGSRGTLVIRAVDGRTIRLEWRTTVSSGGPALTSGIATLVRRQ